MAEQHSSTDVLRQEHQVILRVLEVFQRILDRGVQGGVDLEAVEACATFFRLFADHCHHGKEEDLLFPELEARGLPHDAGPIAVMLYEHRQGRALVSRIFEELPAAGTGDPLAASGIVKAGREFIELLRDHITKEDNVLFVMADRLVDAPACGRLCGAYDQVCSKQFDGRTKPQLEALARELQARYGGAGDLA